MEGDLEDDEDEDEDNLRRGTMRLRGANLGRRSCLALTLSGVRSRGLSHGSAEQDTTVRFSRRSSTPLAGALWRVHLWRVRRRLALGERRGDMCSAISGIKFCSELLAGRI